MVYCSKCGMLNPDGTAICQKCGSQLYLTPKPEQNIPTVNNYYYGRQRRRERREARRVSHGRIMVAPFIFAAIFIVIGMAVFLPNLPWQWFWGVLWILIGGLIAGFWTLRWHQRQAQ
jgi:amino acid transporter